MARSLQTVFFALTLIAPAFADPVPNIDAQKKKTNDAKEIVVKFWKHVTDKEVDEAKKLVTLPFLKHNEVEEEHKSFDREFKNGLPDGMVLKTTDAMELKDLNAYFKKNELAEVTDERMKKFEEHTGKDGRVVILDIKMNGKNPPRGTMFMLIKFKDGKPMIAGIAGNNSN